MLFVFHFVHNVRKMEMSILFFFLSHFMHSIDQMYESFANCCKALVNELL